MKSLTAITAVLLLAGCDQYEPVSAGVQSAEGGSALERFGPDEFGVVCYRKKGYEGISCVMVANPATSKETQK